VPEDTLDFLQPHLAGLNTLLLDFEGQTKCNYQVGCKADGSALHGS
jgi:hypothetical protein